MPKPVQRKKAVRQKVTFEYKRSPQFRNVHADGAWGAITPHGLINMNLYCEYRSAPEQSEQDILQDGSLGIERRTQKRTISREIETGVFLSPEVASALVDWLKAKLDDLEKAKAEVLEK